MLLSSLLATPRTPATRVVPYTTLFRSLLPIATVTAPVNPVATLPSASSARTFTAGLMWLFATVVPGWIPNTRCVAVPAVMRSEVRRVGIGWGAGAARQYLVTALLALRSQKRD